MAISQCSAIPDGEPIITPRLLTDAEILAADKMAIHGLRGSIAGMRLAAEQQQKRIDELGTALADLANALGTTDVFVAAWDHRWTEVDAEGMVKVWRKARKALDPS